MSNNNFDILLLRASKSMGSLLAVAAVLGVEPRQVYRWIAELERPPDWRRGELEDRLSRALGANDH
jgi:hypothetical protein